MAEYFVKGSDLQPGDEILGIVKNNVIVEGLEDLPALGSVHVSRIGTVFVTAIGDFLAYHREFNTEDWFLIDDGDESNKENGEQ